MMIIRHLKNTLFISLFPFSMAMAQGKLAQVRLGVYLMLGLLFIGIIITIAFIRQKPKDKNRKVDVKAYSAD
ncbi:hypothetical protein BKI52_23515 [marine bacterium AO1-C]|nr:hypothetical protein BKI52_23515 [marine bacterium AO1-C]